MEELIAKRYVNALSASSKDIASTAKVLNVLAEAIATQEIAQVISSPLVASEKKTEMVLVALGKKVDSALVNFIKILGEKKRLNLIPTIAMVLNANLQKASNKYEGVVESAQELSSDEIKKLEKSLHKYTGAKVKLTQKKSDLDGIHVVVDDLGIEVNFSKQRVQERLVDFIVKSL